MLEVPKDYVFMVIGANYWGKGDTKKAAVNAAVKAGLRPGMDYGVYLVPPSAYIDGMGRMCWNPEQGKPDNYIFIENIIRKTRKK
jgi:hypothetical protein